MLKNLYRDYGERFVKTPNPLLPISIHCALASKIVCFDSVFEFVKVPPDFPREFGVGYSSLAALKSLFLLPVPHIIS